MSGQMSGQVPNQAGLRGGLQQQNGNPNLFGQVQNQGDHQTNSETDKVRGFVQRKIYDYLMMRRQQQSSELAPKRMVELVKILEKNLFNAASTIEEYMNLETLENRMLFALKHLRTVNQQLQQVNSSSGNQFMQHVNSSSSISKMIPTPGGFMPGGSMGSGSALSNGYQHQTSIFSTTSGGNGMVSSGVGGERVLSQMMPTPGSNGMVSSGGGGERVLSQMMPTPGTNGMVSSGGGGERVLSQMMPTPGTNGMVSSGGGGERVLSQMMPTPGTNGMVSSGGGGERVLSQMMPTPGFVNNNNTNSSEDYRNLESSNGVGIPTVESMMVTKPLHQKQHIGGQNGPILHNVGSYIGGGIRNGALSGFGMNSQSVNGQGIFEGQSPMPQVLQHDSYGSGAVDRSGLGNVYASINSPMLMTSNQINQSNLLGTHQDADVKVSIEQSKINSQSPQSLPDNVVQSRNQQLLQQRHQLHQQQQQNQQHQIPQSGGSQKLEIQQLNQKRWLLFLRHAQSCRTEPCVEKNCIVAQKLLSHIKTCELIKCTYPRCLGTRSLLNHFKNCKSETCGVCVPAREFMLAHRMRKESKSNVSSANGCGDSVHTRDASSRLTSRSVGATEDLHPLKRTKIEQPLQSVAPEFESSQPLSTIHDPPALQEHKPGYSRRSMESDVTGMKMETSASSVHAHNVEVKKEIDDSFIRFPDDASAISSAATGFPKHESFTAEKETDQVKHPRATSPAESTGTTKSGKPEIKGVSLTELFTPDQVREHITGLKQWVGQSKAKVEKNQAMENSMSENSCQLCAVEKLNFEPPPIYCTPCGARIKRNAMYYTAGAGESRQYFCIPCYNETRGDNIVVDGTSFPKARLEKKKNDQETEEGWVQCDKCEAWQHQICALFNSRRNEGGQAEFTCPNCYIAEVERGERTPLPQSAVLGAQDLPKTVLSDHLEQRLFKQLEQERLERARVQGKSYDDVPGAECLVIRVVSSVDKRLEVKQRFLEIFQEVNYPTEFAYKSKVVLLFQKIEGVEVCLFAMYVQEFGADCEQPNHRRVYLSYLDSVKYFRPEIKAVTGEALRTFVYHEILIGYLEYCKKRGFTSCYIWACPPLKGEDYILYCHPEIQKTPKSDKLREWYLSMLKKAAKEKIVVELTNLYDHFFVPGAGECKAKVTAARLPYFDGDYWPGAAEDIIYQLQQEEDGGKMHKKGTTKKTITKRALRASGQADLSGNVSKDLMLMHKLGETISPMKEDFIMVHLQHSCSHCCILMTSGNCWVCRQCKNFKLCDKCHEAEQRLEDIDRHPINNRGIHAFYPVEVTGVPADTQDKDEILESEFFDTRQAFLGLCQGNHYQYDTLRRAKHSSMMVLYHLHNPTAPAFVTACYVCHLDIEAGQGWRCEICPDYDVCNACFQKDGGTSHPHKLTNHPSNADRDAQNKEARQQRVIQLRKMLDLLVHASQCRSQNCPYPNCRKVKSLFRHGIQCKTRSAGGCVLCKRMWYLLKLHAISCRESQCHVPRCRDLREHLRRNQQQADSRRRAAITEMMRQRAAEVAGDC